MQFEGDVVQEQGITFTVVVVKPFINSAKQCNETRVALQNLFPGLPVILMAQDFNGNPTYQERTDIIKFLASVNITDIPWKKYDYS